LKKSLIVSIILVINCFLLNAQDTIRYMQYNLLNYGNLESYCSATTNPTELKDGYLRTIIDYAKPDLFACVEIASSPTVIQHLLDEVLNINGVDYWRKTAMSNFAGSAIVNMLYYNTDKFGLVAQDAVITEPRDINIYKFFFKTNDLASVHDTIFFHVIVAHLKAGNTGPDETARAQSTSTLMQYLSLAYQPGNFIISGDFNLYSSSEQAYVNLLNFNFPAYRFYDPVERPGNWNNNSSFSDVHTQSTHTSGNGCPSTGGLDDRFDFILISDDIKSGHARLQAMPETYHAVGQDGQHFNSAINAPPQNPAAPQNVIEALYGNSDHLPVLMDLKVEKALGLDDRNTLQPWFRVNNPCQDQAHLYFNAMTGRTVTARLFAVNGQEISSFVFRIPSENQVDIDLNGINPGVYFLQLTADGFPVYTRKLINQP